MAKKGTTPVIVASHTHWDRAWYQPFQDMRSRLVQMVDSLLELLKRGDYKVFNFDGQTVVLEDYLAIRPQKRDEIVRLIRHGRLKIGPWYVLADEFLAGGEGLVRNLLIGHRMGEAFGGVQQVGYTPDSFGHIAQMPQILAGFGIDSFIFSRGMSMETAKMGQVFKWRGSDGKSWVYGCWLPVSYGHPYMTVKPVDGCMKRLPWSEIKKNLTETLAKLEKHKHTGALLWCNGNDHCHAEEHLPATLARANRELDGYRFEHAGLDRYVELVRKGSSRLASYRGELRDGGPMGILSGTQSSRMYLKQANFDCLAALAGLAEPVMCLAELVGLPYPHAEITHAWKKVLKNHPHDDICGCSVDGTHADMDTRFRNCLELADHLTLRSLYWISHNAEPSRRKGPRVFAAHGLEQAKAYRLKHTFELPDAKPRTLVVNSAGKAMPTLPGKVTTQPEVDWDIKTGTFRDRPKYLQEIEWLGELPACGYDQFVATFGKQPKTDLKARGTTIENRLVRVKMNADGSVKITDKKTRLSVVGNIFEDNEDAGDGYDYSRMMDSPPAITSRGVRGRVKATLVGTLSAEASCTLTMRVPASLTPNHKARSKKTVPLRITTTARLLPGQRRVEFRTEVDNNATDHRLRVLFASGVQKAQTVDVEGAFDVLQRPIDLPPAEDVADWAQKPISTKHQDGFVSVSDARRGLTVINRGLPEYEARRDRGGVSLLVTLFRAFSDLSRHDHFERGSAAGPQVPTPDAQMLGEFAADYAVIVHSGNFQRAKVWRDSRAFNAAAAVKMPFTETSAGTMSAAGSLLTVDEPAAVISTIKAADKGKGIIVRLWNIGEENISPTISCGFDITSAAVTDMLEQPVRKLKPRSRRGVKLPSIAPKQIVTVLLKYKPLAPRVQFNKIMWPTGAEGHRTY